MEKELHIRASVPKKVQTYKETFYTNEGHGTIELTPLGDYLLTTVGLTDAAARRNIEYKNAYKKVTVDMLHAYEAETRAYTSLHRDMPPIVSVVQVENDLMTLSPQKYQRGHFALSKPTKDDVEEDILEEVRNINFDKTKASGQVDENIFLKEHLNEMIEIRQHAWQEACDYFNRIEDAREERENARFFAEYKTLYNNQKERIEGKESIVEKGLLDLCGSISVPYNLVLTFAYNQASHVLDASVIVEDAFSVPTFKASILTSGKISIKNKLVREVITERTTSAVSLVYFIAAHLFNVSPNIHYLRLSLYKGSKLSPLLWVEFGREKLSRTSPKTVDVISDILGYPIVLEFKNRADSVELCVMDKTSFDNKVAQEVKRVNEIHSAYQATYADLGNNKVAISFEDANLLCGVPNLAYDIHKAMSMAKDRGQSYVAVDKKVKSVLDELKR